MENLISVIVPVYKAEPYIRKCIDSILSQTYKNLEIILVDDGSPDDCGKICDEYADLDTRIKVIHKENGGVSEARNFGMRKASGDYLTFVDIDDYVEQNMMEKLVKPFLQDDSADISMCAYFAEIKKSYSVVSVCNHSAVLNDDEIPVYLHQATYPSFFNHVWNKMFSSRLIKESCVEFDENMSLGEDFVFVLQALTGTYKLALIDEPLYHHVSTEGSLTCQMRPDLWEIEKQIAACYKKYYLDIGKVSMASDAYRRHMIYFIRTYLSSSFFSFDDSVTRIKYISKVLEDEDVKKIQTIEKDSGLMNLVVSAMIKFKMKRMLYLFFSIKNKIFHMRH